MMEHSMNHAENNRANQILYFNILDSFKCLLFALLSALHFNSLALWDGFPAIRSPFLTPIIANQTSQTVLHFPVPQKCSVITRIRQRKHHEQTGICLRDMILNSSFNHNFNVQSAPAIKIAFSHCLKNNHGISSHP